MRHRTVQYQHLVFLFSSFQGLKGEVGISGEQGIPGPPVGCEIKLFNHSAQFDT